MADSDTSIRRGAGQTVEEIAKQLEAAPINRMYSKTEEGSGSREFISELVQTGLESLKTCYPSHVVDMAEIERRGRVNLDDVGEIRDAAVRYLSGCARAGRMPFFTAFCSVLGYSRRYVYDVKQRRRNEATEFLDYFQGLCAGIAEEAATSRKISEVFTIFALKNSQQNYADRIDVTATANKPEPFENGDPEEIARRYLAGVAPATIDNEVVIREV